MPQVLVPGVAQSVISGVRNTQPWACVMHWKYDNVNADWAPSEIQSLATSIMQSISNNWSPMMGSELTVQAVNTVDIGSTSPSVGSDTAAKVGQRTGTPISNTATCALVSCRIPARYRGGHPRIYLPWGVVEDTLNQDHWAVAFVNSASNAFAAFVTAVRTSVPAVSGNQVSHVSIAYQYSYHDDPIRHKYTKMRESVKAIYVVQNYECRSTFGTQRRRLLAA
jgi:hypothetical protein